MKSGKISRNGSKSSEGSGPYMSSRSIPVVGDPPMGSIEISDGISCRQIPVSGLTETIRIELHSAEGPRLIVPDEVAIDRNAAAR